MLLSAFCSLYILFMPFSPRFPFIRDVFPLWHTYSEQKIDFRLSHCGQFFAKLVNLSAHSCKEFPLQLVLLFRFVGVHGVVLVEGKCGEDLVDVPAVFGGLVHSEDEFRDAAHL